MSTFGGAPTRPRAQDRTFRPGGRQLKSRRQAWYARCVAPEIVPYLVASCLALVVAIVIAVVVWWNKTHETIRVYVGNRAAWREFNTYEYYERWCLKQNLAEVQSSSVKEYRFVFAHSHYSRTSEWRRIVTRDQLVKKIEAVQEKAARRQSALRKMPMEEVDHLSGIWFEKMLVQMMLANPRYKSVRQTQASNDYGIDILANDAATGQRLGFQAKRYSSPIGIKAVQEAHAGRDFYQLDRVFVITNSTFTAQARKLAKSLDVGLLDREDLTRWIVEFGNSAESSPAAL